MSPHEIDPSLLKGLPPAARLRVKWATYRTTENGSYPLERRDGAWGERGSFSTYDSGGVPAFYPRTIVDEHDGEAVAFSADHVLVVGDDGSLHVFEPKHLRVVVPPLPEVG